MRLKGKTALITGGNSGIGFATARRFVDEGASVVLTGRDQRTLDRAQRELGPRATAIQVDVVDRVARERLFASIREKVGHLDVVFANAGIAKQGSIADTPEELFDEVFKVNVTGVFLTVQAALPLMRDGGSIILNSSIAATAGVAGSGAYAGSKGRRWRIRLRANWRREAFASILSFQVLSGHLSGDEIPHNPRKNRRKRSPFA
jgi:NAD(P)-dependent dehydrogenase (short-subunit alcohol dehydrogenase family)